MNKKRLTVSIGIPAYNEEANIKNLLLSLIAQKQRNFMLQEIIVVSDKSTDTTIAEIKSIKNRKIQVIENRRRLGQAGGQNKIIKTFKSDILVLLNADVLPSDTLFLSKLITPLKKDKKLGLVGPKIVPLNGETFFEDVINYSIEFKDALFEKVNSGSTLYLCRGAARAFRKSLARKILWKDSVSEDAFSYLSCLSEGYTFAYIPQAILYIKSPNNFDDHFSQSARFEQGPKMMCRFFDKQLVEKMYAIPKKIALITTAEYAIKNPILFFCYLITLFVIKVNPWKGDFTKTIWRTATSSKVLKI